MLSNCSLSYATRATCTRAGLPAESKVELEDGELIRATRRGDPEAFGSLVEKYQDRRCNSLMHVCGSFADAQDAAQEAFVRAYLKLGSFAGESAFYTWLYRIAINARISERRRRRVDTSSELTREACGGGPLDRAERTDERMLREERAQLVQQALGRMREDYRTILVMREFEECDYDTIAAALDVPVGTVRSRLHRARLQLKEALARVLGETSLRIPSATVAPPGLFRQNGTAVFRHGVAFAGSQGREPASAVGS